jgi:RecA-family ATPase
MIENIQDNEIGYWVIDPFVSSHMVNESDNPKIQQVVQKYRHIARVTNSAGELIHHTRKGVAGREPTQDDARRLVYGRRHQEYADSFKNDGSRGGGSGD